MSTPARARRPRVRRRQRRDQGAQSLVEFALLIPIFLLLISGVIDFGRYYYIRGTLEADTREGGRLLTLADNRTTDCPTQQYVLGKDNDIVTGVDPTSTWGDGSSPGTTPPNSKGLIYIYPAVAQNVSTCAAAAGNKRPSGNVTITITYVFIPFTPALFDMSPKWTITTSSTQPTEY